MRDPREPAHDAPQAPELGELFVLTSSDNQTARCVLRGHWAGWELRLLIGETQSSAKVCRTKADVQETSERWRATLVNGGWR